MPVNVTSADVKAAVDLLKDSINDNVATATNLGSVLSDTQAVDAARVSAKTATETRAAEAAALYAGAQAKTTLQAMGEISAAIGGSPVDIFVYDTSLDSDGGAWRKRCRGTSWENEALVPGKYITGGTTALEARNAGGVDGDYYHSSNGSFYQLTAGGNIAEVFRGNRREFPAVALIVVDNSRLVIYDATDPALPMWMVFTRNHSGALKTAINSNTSSAVKAAAASHGRIVVGAYTGGVSVIDFLRDTTWTHYSDGTYPRPYGLDRRNEVLSFAPKTTSGAVVHVDINDVAITVLPGAPIDPGTKLPVPTIAVSTAGGVSVIQNTGLVVNWNNAHPSDSVAFEGDMLVWDYFSHMRACRDIGSYTTNFGDQLVMAHIEGSTVYGPSYLNSPITVNKVVPGAYAGPGGLGRLDLNREDMKQALLATVGPDYCSGWQVGQSQGAWLADTDTSSLSGTNRVTNGTFDTDTAWTKYGGVTISGGVVNASSTTSIMRQEMGLVVGRKYVVSFDYTKSSGLRIRQYGLYKSEDLAASGRASIYFTADVSFLELQADGATFTGTLDNLVVVEADADRSAKKQGLIVNGTVTRAPVADGAELVEYDGGRLDLPADMLNVGTSDFCFMGWVHITANSDEHVFGTPIDHPDHDPDWPRNHLFAVVVDYVGGGNSTIVAYLADGTPAARNEYTSLGTAANYHIGDRLFVVVTRKGPEVALWVNGEKIGSAVDATTINLTNTVPGCIFPFSAPAYSHGLSLLRFGLTAPTPEQIARIYEDERKLFLPGAKCTLTGTSSSVQALAQDPHTDLLHVATDAGRSTFDGLVRIDETATPRTQLAASGGLIAEH